MNHQEQDGETTGTTQSADVERDDASRSRDDARDVGEKQGPVLVENDAQGALFASLGPEKVGAANGDYTRRDAIRTLRRRVQKAIIALRERVYVFAETARKRATEALSFTDEEEKRAYALELARAFVSGMLMTFDASIPHCRPMIVADVERVGEEMVLWFVTDEESAKVEELGRDCRVCITLQGGARYMTIFGHAQVIEDPAKLMSLHHPVWRMWFDERTTPSLIRVRVRELEFWDQSGLRGIRVIFHVARALFNGAHLDDVAQDDWQHGRIVFG